MILFGLALALGSALATNVAFLFKQRGAVAARPVNGRHPLTSAVDLEEVARTLGATESQSFWRTAALIFYM